MFKKALFVLGSAVFMLAIAGCDGSSTPPAGSGAQLPDGIEPFTPPNPGDIESKPRPGSAHSKSSSTDE